jgi:hypothetical protein
VLPPLALRTDLLAGIAAPRPVIEVGTLGDRAVFGRPLLGAGIGLELSTR